VITSIIGRYLGRPKQSSSATNQYAYNCPKCAEANGGTADGKHNLEVKLWAKPTKSGSVNIFHCWKCEMGGDLIFLLKRYATQNDVEKYISFVESMGHVIPEGKKQMPVRLPKGFIPFSKVNLAHPDQKLAYDYMTKVRNIDLETLIKFNVGFTLTGRYKYRIIIPSYNKEGYLNYFSARTFVNHSQKYDSPVNCDKETIIFNEKNIDWNSPIILTEGAIELLACPYNNIVLLGKKLHDNLVMLLLKYDCEVIVALNKDAKTQKKSLKENVKKGKLASTEAVCEFLQQNGLKKIKYVEFPSDDFGKVLQNSGKKGIFDLLRNAVHEYKGTFKP
jgi:hypothetical protein